MEEKTHKEEAKKEHKKKDVAKKTEAIVNGRDIPVSMKHAVAICNFIRMKNIDESIKMLEDVKNYKRAVPMRGEIPHRRGMMSGRFPIKASKNFLELLKSLKSNAIFHGVELESTKVLCKADHAPRPYRRFGTGRFKRAHIRIKLVPRSAPNSI